MRIGLSVVLIAVGLVLALAVDFDLNGINVDMVGWILAAVGFVGLLASMAVARRPQRVSAREYTDLPPV